MAKPKKLMSEAVEPKVKALWFYIPTGLMEETPTTLMDLASSKYPVWYGIVAILSSRQQKEKGNRWVPAESRGLQVFDNVLESVGWKRLSVTPLNSGEASFNYRDDDMLGEIEREISNMGLNVVKKQGPAKKTSNAQTLRANLIRLAYQKDHLRPHLLPLLKKG